MRLDASPEPTGPARDGTARRGGAWHAQPRSRGRRAGMKGPERTRKGIASPCRAAAWCRRWCTGFVRTRARKSGRDGHANGRHVGDDPRRVRFDVRVRAGRFQITAAAAREDAFTFVCVRVRDVCDVRTSPSRSSSVLGIRTAPACVGLLAPEYLSAPPIGFRGAPPHATLTPRLQFCHQPRSRLHRPVRRRRFPVTSPHVTTTATEPPCAS